MSALGQKQTFAVHQTHVRFGSKADMCSAPTHVRFVPKADIILTILTDHREACRRIGTCPSQF